MPGGLGDSVPQGCAAWRRRQSAHPRTFENLVRKERISRFQPIDPVGNGNGKRSFFAGWLRDERPPVPVGQIVSHLNIEPIFIGVDREGVI